jgi:endonuclease/exonuclease/phosphatase family metal-dependent hydrolase
MRLATFNILHGRSTRDGVVDLDRLAAAVRTLDPDILALQEVDRGQPRSHLADLTALAAEAMGAVAHRFAAVLTGTPGAAWMAATEDDIPGTPAYGIALLSRYPAHSWHAKSLPRIPFRFPFYLSEPGKVIVVDDEPRVVLIGHIDTPGGPLAVANTHLSFVPGWGLWQLGKVLRELAPVKAPVVLMGDLNVHNPLPAYLTGYRSLGRHLTFPAEAPNRQLDHILLRGRLGHVVGSAAPLLPLSDHRALTVDLSLSGEEDRP